MIEPGASGNQVLGNQIGVVGPSTNGLYFRDGNGAEGVLIESTGNGRQSVKHCLFIEQRDRRRRRRARATSSRPIRATAYTLSGSVPPGTWSKPTTSASLPAAAIFWEPAIPETRRTVYGSTTRPTTRSADRWQSDGNVISSNQGAGVYITGADAEGTTVLNNIIGLTSSGGTVLGNDEAGVADYSPGTSIGPGNVISANLIGVLISGASATGVVIRDNLIGTDSSGTADLGNAEDGVQIDNASGVTVRGDSQGAQVISGNLVGVEIDGSTSTRNLIEGNLIGTDKSGTADRGNSNEGVLIEGASGNTVGGTTSAALNVISANQWGIRLDGSTSTGNADRRKRRSAPI